MKPSTPIRSKGVATLAALFAMTTPALATGQAPPEPDDEGETVTVTARHAQPLFDSGRSGDVVTHDDLVLQASATLPDALDEIPGVLIQKTDAASGALFIRGLVGRQNLVLIDGVRLNNAIFRSGPVQYLNTLDPFTVQGVEILRGAGSVLYGSDAMGGVVNIKLRGPRQLHGDAGGRSYMRWSSAELGTSGGAAAEYERDGTGVLVGTSLGEIENLRPGNGFDDLGRNPDTITPYTSYGWFGTDMKSRVRLSDQASLQLGANLYRQQGAYRTDKTSPDDIRQRPDQDRDLVMLGYTQTFPSARHLDSVEVKTSWASQREHSLRRRAAKNRYDESRTRDDQMGLVATVVSPLDRRAHYRLTYGGDVSLDTLTTTATEAPIVGSGGATSVRPSLLDGSRSTLAGVFLMSESQLTEDVRFDFGGRFTVAQAHIPADPLGYGAYSFQDTGTVFHAALLTYLTDRWNISTSISQGFRAPNLEDLTGLTQGAEGTDRPNPELTSEQSVTVDFGSRIDLAMFRGELALFATTIEDLIARQATGDLDPDNTDADGRPLPFNEKVNTAAARIVGAEVKTEFLLSAHLSLGLSGAWILSKDADEDTPLRREPPTRGRINTRYKRGTWRVETYANWALAQDRLSAGDLGDERICPGELRDNPQCPGTDGYVVFGARGDVEVIPNARVGVVIDNLLDRAYKVHGSGIERPGLNATVSARATF